MTHIEPTKLIKMRYLEDSVCNKRHAWLFSISLGSIEVDYCVGSGCNLLIKWIVKDLVAVCGLV